MNLIKYLYNAYVTYRKNKISIQLKHDRYKRCLNSLELKHSEIESRISTAKFFQKWLGTPEEVITWGKIELALFDNVISEFKEFEKYPDIFPNFDRDLSKVFNLRTSLQKDYFSLVKAMEKNALTNSTGCV